MTNLAKIKRLYLWKPSICKTFWTTLVLHWADTQKSEMHLDQYKQITLW